MKKGFLILSVILIAGLTLIAGTLLIAWFFFPSSLAAGSITRPIIWPALRTFESNGERIYFTGTSASGPRITAQMPGMHRIRGIQMACASCHGEDGRGGTVRLMMDTINVPDIRYHTLTEGVHGDDHDHPVYTDEDIVRAITRGVNPIGEPLERMMPRWNMSAEQLEDLLDYLKTLE
jgi:cytochrome c oxidase subunit II